MGIQLDTMVSDIADCLAQIDASGARFKEFAPGVGPYGEPQLVKMIAERLNRVEPYLNRASTKRTPDLLITGVWAIEVKIARPFGDNGKLAENWSVNLLHPYEGNVSALGDCMKLLSRDGPERKAILVIGYEHSPPQVQLNQLFDAFQAIAAQVCHISLTPRVEATRSSLAHPVHQQLRVVAWEVLGRLNETT